MRYSRAIKVIMGFTITVVLMSGCAMNRVNLVESQMVYVENVKHDKAHIYGVNVYQDDKTLVISGSVGRRHNINLPINGHVDLILIASNGSILKKIGTNYNPGRLPGRRAGRSYFEAKIPVILPPGSRVRVEFHNIPEIPPSELLLNQQNEIQRPEKIIKAESYPTYVT